MFFNVLSLFFYILFGNKIFSGFRNVLRLRILFKKSIIWRGFVVEVLNDYWELDTGFNNFLVG